MAEGDPAGTSQPRAPAGAEDDRRSGQRALGMSDRASVHPRAQSALLAARRVLQVAREMYEIAVPFSAVATSPQLLLVCRSKCQGARQKAPPPRPRAPSRFPEALTPADRGALPNELTKSRQTA